MDINNEYIVYLENRLRLREKSRSYRWMLPARFVWNILYPSCRGYSEGRMEAFYRERLKFHEADFSIIKNSGKFNAEYACPWIKNDLSRSVHEYIDQWNKKNFLRKPHPGFHPGIYASKNPGITSDPFAHYLRSGMPSGPWSLPVISLDTKIPLGVELARAALHLHFYYADQVDSIVERIYRNRSRPDIFVSIGSTVDKRMIEDKFRPLGGSRTIVRHVPNCGRNFGSLLTAFPEIFNEYEIVGHLHSKRSPHLANSEEGIRWGDFLYTNLLGKEFPMMDTIIASMSRDKSLGLVFPDDPHVFGWFRNASLAVELAAKIGLNSFTPVENINFPAGSMFWARTGALQPLLDLNLSWGDYPLEPLGDDGSELHALERMMPVITQHAGFKSAVTYVPGTGR